MKTYLNNKNTMLLNKNKKIKLLITIKDIIKQPITDGLMIWFDGRDGSCEEKTTTWVDRSGNNYNATLTGFGDFTTNEWTGYGLFLQSSGRTVLLDNANIPLPNNEITLEVYGINYNDDWFSGLIADHTAS